MWVEHEIKELYEPIEAKPWYKKAIVWFAAAVVPAALIINIVAPTLKTMAAERVYMQTLAEQDIVRDFATLNQHALPNSTVHVITYFNLPDEWHVSEMKINGDYYTVSPGFDSYLVQLTTPYETGYWYVNLEAVTVFDGAIYHEIETNQKTKIGVDNHVPHFEEVHPHKPKISEGNTTVDDHPDEADQSIQDSWKVSAKDKITEGEKIKSLEKYAMTEDKNLAKKMAKVQKDKFQLIPTHGPIVAVFIQDVLYPALINEDGALQIFGLPNNKQQATIDFFVYEDGHVEAAQLSL